MDTLSCVYGVMQTGSSIEQSIKNKWVRDVLENERELDWYKTQYLAAVTLMPILHKSEHVLELHKKLVALCYPWEVPEKEGSANLEDAIKKFQEMQEKSTIQDVKKDVEVNELFVKWKDPLQEEGSN